ncbi:ferredoxin [Streptomyces sp. NPDC088915]
MLLLHAVPPAAQRATVRMAVGVCPSGAITLQEPRTDDCQGLSGSPDG